MASMQTNGFTESQTYFAQIFKALAHPARMAILDKLISKDWVNCKEFTQEFPLSQATISNHLKVLLESGVLGYEKVQNLTYYRINPLMLEGASKIIQSTINETNRQDHDYQRTFFKVLPNEEFSVD